MKNLLFFGLALCIFLVSSASLANDKELFRLIKSSDYPVALTKEEWKVFIAEKKARLIEHLETNGFNYWDRDEDCPWENSVVEWGVHNGNLESLTTLLTWLQENRDNPLVINHSRNDAGLLSALRASIVKGEEYLPDAAHTRAIQMTGEILDMSDAMVSLMRSGLEIVESDWHDHSLAYWAANFGNVTFFAELANQRKLKSISRMDLENLFPDDDFFYESCRMESLFVFGNTARFPEHRRWSEKREIIRLLVDQYLRSTKLAKDVKNVNNINEG